MTARILRAAVFMVSFLVAGTAFAAGACPSGISMTGNNCFFIAANGADTNNGTSESTPWLHAPGMPNCSGTCATVQTALGTACCSNPVYGFVFRGGDTWHFGNASAAPYTGGTWKFLWSGTPATCTDQEVYTGCFYIGVDSNWYNSSVCGASWCRPKFNGDNPLSTSPVSRCTYQSGPNNQVLAIENVNSYILIEGFEFLGLCSDGAARTGQPYYDNYLMDIGSYNSAQEPCHGGLPPCSGLSIKKNLYFHGWTVTTAETQNPNAPQCYLMPGGASLILDHVVVDGSDSGPGYCVAMVFPDLVRVKDSIFRYTTQIVATECHDIHDNIFEHFYSPIPLTHGNLLECNNDGTWGPANVFYNNIVRHQDPGFNGQVMLWFCPNTTPEYWFNNLVYDAVGAWDYAGPPNYPGCPLTGGQWMFNNTLVDQFNQPCNLSIIGVGGKYLHVFNEHLINTPYDSGTTPCDGGPASSSNVAMSDATATNQGYTSGLPGTFNSNNCANEASKPCSPRASNNGTVGSGVNYQSICNTIASYTSDLAMSVPAASACRQGTTDACTYIASNHTMFCPAQTTMARPTSVSWDSGAYQFGGGSSSRPNPPTGLKATVR